MRHTVGSTGETGSERAERGHGEPNIDRLRKLVLAESSALPTSPLPLELARRTREPDGVAFEQS
jgi:hypothetical protein